MIAAASRHLGGGEALGSCVVVGVEVENGGPVGKASPPN
jgi:hypothetical protein